MAMSIRLQELNIEKLFFCKQVNYVIIDKKSYCIKCASRILGAEFWKNEDIPQILLKNKHCVVNTNDSIKAIFCQKCECATTVVNNVYNCEQCSVLIHKLFDKAILNGFPLI
jgi:hypothetical protein